jgi:mRNA-degrading endonuclease RelE of RelBE toxin-antitoxin system
MARVTVSPDAARQLESLPRPIQVRIVHLFDRLRQWPNISGAKPLRGGLAGRYRLRTGDYRLQFRVQGDEVHVEKLGNRDRFYEE